MENNKKQSNKRRFVATVVSDKMDKTVVVKVDRTISHAKYGKRYTVSKRLKAHDEGNTAKVGDQVLIEETAPKSKDKNWRIVNQSK
ncbi:MAG: 30S ribosomal protein S17 [Patescibacteria group bacterium]|nr:30S ribosomal protein S17 [Patescibacteria group bacterium]